MQASASLWRTMRFHRRQISVWKSSLKCLRAKRRETRMPRTPSWAQWMILDLLRRLPSMILCLKRLLTLSRKRVILMKTTIRTVTLLIQMVVIMQVRKKEPLKRQEAHSLSRDLTITALKGNPIRLWDWILRKVLKGTLWPQVSKELLTLMLKRAG